jgi:hypothetical protein
MPEGIFTFLDFQLDQHLIRLLAFLGFYVEFLRTLTSSAFDLPNSRPVRPHRLRTRLALVNRWRHCEIIETLRR